MNNDFYYLVIEGTLKNKTLKDLVNVLDNKMKSYN